MGYYSQDLAMTQTAQNNLVNVAFSLENVDPNSYEINLMHPEDENSSERCVFFIDPGVIIGSIKMEKGKLVGTGLIARHNVPVFAEMKDILQLKSLAA